MMQACTRVTVTVLTSTGPGFVFFHPSCFSYLAYLVESPIFHFNALVKGGSKKKKPAGKKDPSFFIPGFAPFSRTGLLSTAGAQVLPFVQAWWSLFLIVQQQSLMCCSPTTYYSWFYCVCHACGLHNIKALPKFWNLSKNGIRCSALRYVSKKYCSPLTANVWNFKHFAIIAQFCIFT